MLDAFTTVSCNCFYFFSNDFPPLHSVRKPENVSHVDAACAIGDSIKAYTALFYQAKIQSGETILIMDACSVNYYLDVFKID